MKKSWLADQQHFDGFGKGCYIAFYRLGFKIKNIQTAKIRARPMKKVPKMLSEKQELIMNRFDTNPKLSFGIVEGFNNKAKPTIKKACGFKDGKYLQYALYLTLGELPMPRFTHRFNG